MKKRIFLSVFLVLILIFLYEISGLGWSKQGPFHHEAIIKIQKEVVSVNSKNFCEIDNKVYELKNENLDEIDLNLDVYEYVNEINEFNQKLYVSTNNRLLIYDENLNLEYSEKIIDKVIYKEIIESIDKSGLTEKENKAFRLYYLNDLSVKEISIILKTTESNIKYFLYNARNKIKEKYYE